MYETDNHKDEAKHWESLNGLAPDAKDSLKKVIEEESGFIMLLKV